MIGIHNNIYVLGCTMGFVVLKLHKTNLLYKSIELSSCRPALCVGAMITLTGQEVRQCYLLYIQI